MPEKKFMVVNGKFVIVKGNKFCSVSGSGSWEDPVVIGDNLQLTQLYGATQNINNLEVE